MGADSTIAPLFAVGVARFAASGTPGYQDLAGILAVMVGALVALVWLARPGWISELLSAPIIAGLRARACSSASAPGTSTRRRTKR